MMKHFIFQVLIGLWIYIESFHRTSCEMTEGMSWVTCGPLNLVCPPHVTEFIFLMFTLNDPNFILNSLLMKHGTDQIGDKPETKGQCN